MYICMYKLYFPTVKTSIIAMSSWMYFAGLASPWWRVGNHNSQLSRNDDYGVRQYTCICIFIFKR